MRFGENDNEKKYPKFVIVDDKQVVNKGHEWSNRFVRTKSNIGLTNERAQRMIESLERCRTASVIACSIRLLLYVFSIGVYSMQARAHPLSYFC